jgi:hypothetical protein
VIKISMSRRAVAVASLLLALTVVATTVTACGDDEEAPASAENQQTAAPPEPPKPEAGTGGGGSFVIQVDCPVGTLPELEDNNAADKANELGSSDLSFCGSISPADDVDFSKFKTPEGKKLTLFQAVIEGAVDFDLVVNGKTLKPTEVKKFEAGEYVIKAYTKDGKPGRYRYRIQFEN